MLYFIMILLIMNFSACQEEQSVQEMPPFKGVFHFNPNQSTPLSGVFSLSNSFPQAITITVQGKTPEMDVSHTFPAQYGKNLPIHGLYPNYTNTIIIRTKKDILTNTVVTAPIRYKNGKVKTDFLPIADPFNQDLYFVNHLRLDLPEDDRNTLLAYDRKGDIRYINYNHKVHYLYEDNQQVLIKNNNGIFDLLNNSVFNYKQQTNWHIHHDSLEIAEGQHILLANSRWGVEDLVIVIDDQANTIKEQYLGSLIRDIIKDPKEIEIMNKIIFDDKNIYRNAKRKSKSVDWAHANSVVYDEKQDILYISVRNMAVMAIDYDKWSLLWWMADDTLNTIHEGIPYPKLSFLDLPSLVPYRVKGAGIKDGPKNQHALFLFKNGNLGMFDNQGDRWKSKKGSRYIEYRIKGQVGSWTAEKVREYKDDALYSRITSDIDLVGEEHQNLLLAWGVSEDIREIDPQNKILFDMNVKQDWAFYRVDKMPLYLYQDTNKVYSLDANNKNKNPY